MGKLIDNHIYPIPAGDILGYDKDRVFILYAPFSGRIALALPNEVEGLDTLDNTKNQNILDSFQAKGEIKIDKIPNQSSDIWQIDILNNYTCNFHCVYCYSAKGRSNKQIEWMKVKVLIDYLFAPGRDLTRPYQINFSGGGEPLMSYDLIKQTVLYIEQINQKAHYPYNLGIVTNGSLIRPDIIDFFTEHQVDMAVSFEIFKDLQNAERGSYDRVVENIDYMLERGYSFGIRTTLTPLSIHRMKAMVEEVATRFPKLKTMVFDVVLDPSLFAQPCELETYYDAFLQGFYEAKSIARQFGIRVESNAVELLGIFRDRYCLGKIVLTPEGSLSVCARVSSPKESQYEEEFIKFINQFSELLIKFKVKMEKLLLMKINYNQF